MAERIYRGTSIAAATSAEFQEQAVLGSTFDVVSGFMDPDDINEDHTAQHVDELPWEVGPREREVGVAGGFTDRLGVAESFSGGAIPVVFHLDGGRLGNLVSVQYDYDFYNDVRGSMPWVDGVSGGELRINEQLEGLLNPEEEGQTIRRYGDDVRAAARRHSEEMEMLSTSGSRVDISRATEFVASYIHNPKQALLTLDGFGSGNKWDPDDATDISDWSNTRMMNALYRKLRARCPDEWDVYALETERYLTMEAWGHDPDLVHRVYHDDREISPSEYPDGLLGK